MTASWGRVGLSGSSGRQYITNKTNMWLLEQDVKDLKILTVSEVLTIENTRAAPEIKGKKMADVTKKKLMAHFWVGMKKYHLKIPTCRDWSLNYKWNGGYTHCRVEEFSSKLYLLGEDFSFSLLWIFFNKLLYWPWSRKPNQFLLHFLYYYIVCNFSFLNFF